MNGESPFAATAVLSEFTEACLAPSNLDDLFELAMNHLLDIDHVREVEIWMFNKKNDMMLVAEGKKQEKRIWEKHRVTLQSWILDSAVRHSTRRVKLPSPFAEVFYPLKTSHKSIGLLKIRLAQVREPKNELSAHFKAVGHYLSARTKEIMLRDEIHELSQEIQDLSRDNADNRRRITSLSKELYAISAISTKINRSLDLKKSLRKSVAKLKEVFKASAALVYLKEPGQSLPKLFTSHGMHMNRKFASAFLEKVENAAIRDCFNGRGSQRVGFVPLAYHPKVELLEDDTYRSMVVAPMIAKKKLIGVLILLYESAVAFNQDNMRLLCGIGDIMGMATENMNLYRQSQRKKKTAAFLVQSMSKFNEKLNLQKTLKSIAEKGAEFMGSHCRVYLFTETRIPMIHLDKGPGRGEASSKAESFDSIEPEELRDFYERMRHLKRPSLISDIPRSKKVARRVKSFFDREGIRSVVSVPLTLIGKSMGLLLFCAGGAKRSFDHLDLSVAEALGAAASVAIENSRAYTASVEMSDFLEKKILEKTAQIQQIQKKMDRRIENRKDVVFRINTRNRFIFVNQAMEALTGLGREEICREDFAVEDFVVPEDRERVANCFQIVLSGELPMVKDLVYRHIDHRGTERSISLTIYPETNENGDIVGVEGVGRDITDKKRLEAELEKTKDLALLGEFSSAIAHQVRNPLGNILMGTKLLKRSLGLEDANASGLSDRNRFANSQAGNLDMETLADIFQNLSDGINNLNQVVTELVEYTKTLKLSRSSQNIQIILEENLSIFDDMVVQRGIRVEKYFEEDIPALSVDAVLIGQVFQNIIHNSIQAMPEGGRLIVSTVCCPEKNESVVISIGDTGAGISPADSEKIFHPFYTTKDSGTGLGLSLAHRIVEAHKGEIRVCSNPCQHSPANGDGTSRHFEPPEKGVTFHIALPSNLRKKRNFQDRVNR